MSRTDNPGQTSYETWYQVACGESQADFSLIEELLALAPPGPILDVGCGTGRILDRVTDRQAWLIDANPTFLNMAKERKSRKANDQFILADALNIPLPDASVSAICIMNNALAEMWPAPFVLAEMARVLTPGGVLLTATRNPSSASEVIFGPRELTIDGRLTYSSYESFRAPSVGPHSYFCVVKSRTTQTETHFVVPQVYYPVSLFDGLLCQLGLETIVRYGNLLKQAFCQSSSPAIFNFARKVVRKDDPVFPKVFRLYQTSASTYEKIVVSSDYRIPAWLKDTIEFKAGPTKNLDLACGTGTVGKLLRALGEKGPIFGVDISPNMTDIAAQSDAYTSLINLDLCRGFHFYEGAYFDRIFLCSASEFISNIPYLIQNVAPALARKGQLYISFELKTENSVPFGEEDPRNGLVKHTFTQQEVETMMQQAGLSITHCTSGPGYVSPSTGDTVPYLFVVAERRNF